MILTILIVLRLCLLFAISATEVSATTPTERKPNVMVIRADDLGYGGADDIATPNIDCLANTRRSSRV